MLSVQNKKTVRHLSFQAFRANKIRNFIGVIAIALTTVLFTALFTVAITMNYSFEQQTIRQVGGYSHGGFKELDREQVDQLKNHPLIQEYGETYIFAIPLQEPFHKSIVEIRYADDNYAKFTFATPTTGRMPVKEKEIATDTAVLELLGVPAVIGEEVTLTYPLGEEMVTDTFTLCGFWEQDKASNADMIWLSKEYVLSNMEKISEEEMSYGQVGKWFLDIMFKDSKHIEDNLRTIAEDNGYTIDDVSAENYIDTGINWAYTSTHIKNSDLLGTIALIVVIAMVILFTGYLIIYNVFQISVAGDVRFYGLLKTIGTTGKQIKQIIRYQALLLTLIGIPAGLVLGYGLGNSLSRIIMSTMTTTTTYATMNPWIFIGAALFALITVIISCRKPGKMAARVSPVEAVRYTEIEGGKKNDKKIKRGNKIISMALANLARNRKKTVLVILSLTLSVVLLNTTYSFTQGFNVDRFLEKFVVSDFVVGNAKYFQSRFHIEENGKRQEVPKELTQIIDELEGIEETGAVNYYTGSAQTKVTQAQWLRERSYWPEEELPAEILEMDPDELIDDPIAIYGLDDLPMSYLKLVEGTIDMDILKNTRSIIQIIHEDDYGNPYTEDAIFGLGDKITISYHSLIEDGAGNQVMGEEYKKEYEVVATVVMPRSISTRWSGSPEFALSSNILEQDAKEDSTTMNYLANAKEESISEIETFLQNYTENVDSSLDFESKNSFTSEFTSFQMMFLLVGGALSFIIGLVGILNFTNAEITSIFSRKRELAMLQSIGMTGKQVKKMLVIEGIFYGLMPGVIAAILNIFIYHFLMDSMEQVFWFFSKRFTMGMIWITLPAFVLLGIIIPMIAYRTLSKESIVERLRDGDT